MRAVALQNVVGRTWPAAVSKERASDDRREAALWQARRAPQPEKLCRPAPSRRAARAHMPRRVFVALALGWGLAVVGLLAAILAIRWLG
jgi:hypothetical protein